MRRWIWIVVALALLGAAVTAGPSVRRFLEIDACLDRGGAWNYDLNVCEDV